MKISFLGAAGEVGRSAILVSDKQKILLDYGIKINPDSKGIELPHKTVPDFVFVSHAHLDHIGAVPYLIKYGYKGLFYASELTFQLGRIMLEDSAKIAHEEGYPARFSKADIQKTLERRFSMNYDKLVNFGEFSAKLVDAGHIPGSAGIFMKFNSNKKTLFYTGDIRLTDTRLILGAKKVPKCDILITESTYGEKDHPDRRDEERRFANLVKETVEQGGTVLVPTFALGRSQEMLLILHHHISEKYPVYLDGMARGTTDVIKKYYSNLRYEDELEEVCKKIKFIKNNEERKKILQKPGIIVTTAGYMQAGPSVFYMRELCLRKESSVLIPGFQVEGSPGRKLLETGKYDLDEEEITVGMKIEKFDFSAHGDRKELLEIVRRASPEKVFVIHGDRCNEFAHDIKRDGTDAVAPELGEEFEI